MKGKEGKKGSGLKGVGGEDETGGGGRGFKVGMRKLNLIPSDERKGRDRNSSFKALLTLEEDLTFFLSCHVAFKSSMKKLI